MNIAGFIQKCKSKEVYTVMIIVMVGFGSFGLGRLSVLYSKSSPVEITGSESESNTPETTEPVAPEASNPAAGIVNAGLVVASKAGTKYHYPWCAGAKQIAEKNKISFATIAEARAAGYTPASNCKGLK